MDKNFLFYIKFKDKESICALNIPKKKIIIWLYETSVRVGQYILHEKLGGTISLNGAAGNTQVVT